MEQPIILRRQANPLLFHQLTDSQRQVCTQILKMLQAYGLHNQNQSSIGSVQTDRVNNLIFIDGNRGIGKSTVMLSLIQGCMPQARAKFLQPVPATQTAGTDSVWLKENLWKDPFLDQLVWLDILDLELLPQNTNLLASILVRIENAFKHVSAFSEPEKKSVLFPSSPTHPWTDFKKLMNDVSLGWDSSLIQRRNTDPDTYSQELMRTERARLSFADFHESLEKIGKLYQELKRTQFKPLFILPVDDADLNPHRYLELFRLTRLLNCNNLIFLVAGNVENLELLLELSFANELNQISSANFLKDKHERISGLAGKLGYAAYRKLIPPSPHLIRVKPLSVEEGFLFKPENAPEVDQTEVMSEDVLDDWTLKGLLEAITLPIFGPSQQENPKKNTLYRDYLKPSQSLADLINLTSTHETSRLAHVVAGPSRAIYDLWLELRELYEHSLNLSDEREKLAELIVFLANAYRKALNESHDFPSDVHDQFIDLFLPTGGYSIQQRIQRQFNVEPESLSRQYEGDTDKEHYQFRKPGPFKLSFIKHDTENKNEEESKNKSEKRYQLKESWKNSWAYLLHDVSLLMPGNTIERLDFSKLTRYWAQSHISVSSNETAIEWPCPDWICFHYYERFRLYWNACLEEMPKIETLNPIFVRQMIENEAAENPIEFPDTIIPTPLNYLAYCWINGINQLLSVDQDWPITISAPAIETDEGYGQNVKDFWDRLAEESIDIIDSAYKYQNLEISRDNFSHQRFLNIKQWLKQIFVMLSPEVGLPLECIKTFEGFINKIKERYRPQGSTPLFLAEAEFANEIIEDRAKRVIKQKSNKREISQEEANLNLRLLEDYQSQGSFEGHLIENWGPELKVAKVIEKVKVLLGKSTAGSGAPPPDQ